MRLGARIRGDVCWDRELLAATVARHLNDGSRCDLRGILRARNLSIAMMGNIRQNLFFAFVYNVIGVPIAAGVLFPFVGLLLNPMIAAAAMSFSSVSVIANSLRLRAAKL